MTPETITHVRASWRQVQPIAPQAAALFYANLFEADPTLRPLFRTDLPTQGERLMKAIGLAVDRLDDLPALVPLLENLGRRHAGYGVVDAHYRTVGDALLRTLGQGLGEQFTPEVRDAWAQTYGAMAGVMMAAAAVQPA
jgi:hemoglobin-like flavoprotein